MIGNAVKYVLLALVLVLLAGLLAGYWMVGTSAGTRWLWERATPLVPGKLEAGEISGSVAGGLDLAAVSYASDAIAIDIDKARLELRFVLFPLTITVRELRAERIVILQKDNGGRDESSGPLLEKLALPFAIQADQVSVRDLELRDSAGQRVFALDTAELAGRWHEEISVTRLELDSAAGALAGQLRVGLARPHPASAAITVTHPMRREDGSVLPVQVTVNASGSLADLQVDASSVDPSLRITGTLSDLAAQPGWNLRVQAPYFQWPLAANASQVTTNVGEAPQVALREVELETSGDLSGYRIDGVGKVSIAGTGELQFTLGTDGDLDRLEVDRLDLQGEMAEAAATGEFWWRDGLSVAADADIARFDIGALTPKWPSKSPLSGTVDLAWSTGKLALNEVRLRVGGAATTVDATGEVDLDGGVVDLDLDWRDLQWPMAGQDDGGTTRLTSEFGQLEVSGDPDDWVFDGRLAFRAADLPQGVFVLSGRGNRGGVEATLDESEVLGGIASGRASYSWEDQRWSAALVTENLDITPLSPQFPGRISSDFTAEGRLDPLQVAVDIRRLDGAVRDKPLTGEGRLQYVDGNLSAEDLRLASGESRLTADGSLTSDSGLGFMLDVAALGAFHPDMAGSLQAQGNISLSGDFPSLRLDLQGKDLQWGEYALQELAVTSDRREAGLPISLDASGAGLSIGTNEVERFSVQLGAGATRQRLGIGFSAADRQAALELDGRLEDWRRPLDSEWSGQLRSASFTTPQDVSFTLAEPAGVRLATDLASLERACLVTGAASRVCLEANWAEGINLDAAASMTSVPVNLVDLVYDTGLEFTQTLDGSLSISDSAGGALSGTGQIDFSAGRIQSRTEAQLTTHTGPGVLQFDLVEGKLLTGRLTLPFSDSAEIDASVELADISRGGASSIDGRLLVNLSDIAVVASMIPTIEGAEGSLAVDLGVAGTLRRPLVAGNATLRKGAFRFDPLGLHLTEIDLETVIHDNSRVDLRSTFRAGDGIGELRSSATSINGIRDRLELSLTGQNLTVIDLPDINVVADTDLGIGVEKETLTINGNVLIPRARLSPTDLTSPRVGESKDVVIVASRDEEAQPAREVRAPFEMAGAVALVLGKDVIVDLDVAEARLSGTSVFRWNGPPVPNAHGQYNVAGRFEAYGQLLEITEGLIQFPGIPASNPNLRIRAEREIFGNPQIRSAGVLITGTANDPVVEVYTNPRTTQDRAVTLLVTGSDFNYEQGVGAVDVGTYIAPKLFVSYGIGLFERGNVISVRYDLGKGFGVKATSGKNADGVDLSYTVER